MEQIAALPFPNIDPVALELGPVVIRWYALAYIAGFLFAWWYLRHIVVHRAEQKLGAEQEKATPEQIRAAAVMTRRDVDDAIFWAIIGVILGGRLGYVLFYKPAFFMENPDQVFAIWGGGMSFHGGLLGIILTILLFSRARGLKRLSVGDVAACAAPVGLFLGRLANFVNGELWGRPTDVPWAMVFPADKAQLPRHPSQIYEALLEGLFLFVLLWVMRTRFRALDRPGELGGLFIGGYGVSRFIVEFFRQPDAHLGLLFFELSMGQLLSIPLILFGGWLVWRARRLDARAAAA